MLLFSYSVMFNVLRPHKLQHTRLSCPSPSPRVCSNSCSLSWWCHWATSFSVIPFSFCLQSFIFWDFFFLQIFIFWMLSFNPDFSLSCFTFIKRHFSSYSLVPPSSLVPCIRIENSYWKFCVISALGTVCECTSFGRLCVISFYVY